ncbi:MAG: type II toxin-antitoxin system PemK/MazF family toxin [Halobacteriales archaeon]|nr:type II toxin-antitoxin system PemK/MazF family toxin [Halobacteriales archaeon]
MRYEQGAVVWGKGLVRDERPWVVVSNRRHPFKEEECVVVAVTTTERERAVRLEEEDFSEGGVPRTSYVSPWFVTTRKTASLNERQGLLRDGTFKHVHEEILRYLEPL